METGGPGGIHHGHEHGRLHRFGGLGRATPSRRDQRDPAVAVDARRRVDDLRRDVADLRRREVRLETRLDQLSRSLRGYPRVIPPLTRPAPPDAPCVCPPAAPPSFGPSRDAVLHAPSPIGRVAHTADAVPPPPIVPRIANYFDVTNLGTLLDVLA